MGIPEKIKAIQDEIHRTQLNKATKTAVLLSIVRSASENLRDLFNKGKHPAFNRLIIQKPESSGKWVLNI